MAVKNDQKVDENVKFDTNKDVLDIKKELPKRKSYKVLVLSSFIQKLKEDKLYFVCFIITIFAFTVFSTSKVKEADGAFTKKEDNVVVDNNNTSKEETKDTTKLDVSDFVGVYVKSYTLDKSIKYDDTCEVSKYDFVYEVKKDNTILRYIVNECFGKVLLSSDKLEYIGTGNSRNIGSKRAIYVFNGNKLSEVDGLTYVKNNKYDLSGESINLVNSKFNFYGDKFIVLNNKSMYYINGAKVEYQLVPNTLMDKTIFKTGNTYRYFEYDTGETLVCYEPGQIAEVGFQDKLLYTIYLLEFDEDTLSFKEPQIENVRNKSASCQTLNDDLAGLSE